MRTPARSSDRATSTVASPRTWLSQQRQWKTKEFTGADSVSSTSNTKSRGVRSTSPHWGHVALIVVMVKVSTRAGSSLSLFGRLLCVQSQGLTGSLGHGLRPLIGVDEAGIVPQRQHEANEPFGIRDPQYCVDRVVG